MEAVGPPAGWYICQDIVRVGCHIAILGVHGQPVTIALEKMWFWNFRLTASLMHGYSIASLMETVIKGEVNPNCLISHKMPMSQMEKAYNMFQYAEFYKTLKILIVNDIC
jgi:alcohol dehydrogenase